MEVGGGIKTNQVCLKKKMQRNVGNIRRREKVKKKTKKKTISFLKFCELMNIKGGTLQKNPSLVISSTVFFLKSEKNLPVG